MSDAPIESSRSDIAGTVEVFFLDMEGLDGIEDFSYIYLLWVFHRSEQKIFLRLTFSG